VILGTVVLTAGIVVAIFAATVAALVAIARLLAGLDRERRADDEAECRAEPESGDEPAWWPDFERQFADYASPVVTDRAAQ
jgi:hypothetical protein